MKKIIIIITVLVVIALGWYLGSPLFIDREISEEFPGKSVGSESEVGETIIEKTGSFSGFDRLHSGSGTAKLIDVDGRKVIRFEDDFNVTNGPDLYVGFGKDGKYIEGSEISKLKGNIGSQNYEIPAGVDISDYNEVWVWCKAFSVPFAKASLK